MVGLSFAAGWWIVSPLLIGALGVPRGLGEDYTTLGMVMNGLGAQGISLSLLAFSLYRFWLRGNRGTLTPVDWYATLNPLTVTVGFLGVAMIAPGAADTHFGLVYFRLPNALIWAAASIVLDVVWHRRYGAH
jgi:hypothetical protein